ncbi:hypothetical protein AAFC00_003970 [Neodothiora populina]|uniref:VLRF1 domain-containing protein n=1 Tax=Neodothiora populina TaxID=2781224 RepID=A0ABR3PI35_9PEZI
MASNTPQPSGPGKEQAKYLQRPLYVFDLPEELLYTLELKPELNDGLEITAGEDDTPESTTTHRRSQQTDDVNEDGSSGGGKAAAASATSCALCNLNFPTVHEQRSHVRSDMHGYNIKRKMRGLKAVDEQEFEKLVGDLDESLSGSDDDDDDDDSADSTLSALLRKQADIADPDFEEEELSKRRKKGAGKAPLLWFTSDKLPKNTSLGVYRALFTPAEQQLDSKGLVEVLQRKQLSARKAGTDAPQKKDDQEDGGVALPSQIKAPTTADPHYFLCMIGGGHFAAMIISLTPKTTCKNGLEERSATVIAQKTFHRYTTRRKQGGSQSANDNSKGNAHSAGASIRRYNETALVADVRGLLSEWKDWISTSDLLFVRATGSTNRKTLFENHEGRVLDIKDTRIRGFPFSTRRATQSELIRSFTELTRVKTTTIDIEALRLEKVEQQAQRSRSAAEAATKQAQDKEARQKAKQQAEKDDEAGLHTTQIQSLIRRSKAPALVSYLTTNSLSPDFLFHPANDAKNHHAPRPLHLAASLNSAACVSALLQKCNANPTLRTSDDQKTAFELAGDRATRDAFRLARHELGDSMPWGSWHDDARVPSALTKSEVDTRAQREKADLAAAESSEAERRKAETEKLREADRIAEAAKREKKFGKGKSVGGLGIMSDLEKSKTAQEKREQEARGMTAEMRLRLERERRARAAEARFAKK